MHCTACGHDNRDSAKFCGACATPLASECICSSCGTKNPTGQKFCDECGASLVASGKLKATSQSASASLTSNNLTTNNLSDARKVVTIVFADLIGSTSLHERLDAESVRRVMERYYQALQTAVENHGGTVVKLLGDGVMAAFGVPRVAEDDAIRAVRAAVEMVQVVKLLVVRRLGEGNLTTNNLTTNNLSIRVAVNTGEVVVSADNTDVVGDPVNVAARLQQEARDGEVLIGESTRRLVGELVTLEPAGVFTLKGRSESVAAYRVLSLERPAGAATTGFVGRDDELRRITAVYDAAVVERRARLAVVLGSPGLGKSRLLDEFGRRLGPSAEGFGPQAGDRATVLSARCEATGGSTFAPVAEAVRTFLRTEDSPGGVRRTTHERAPATAQGVALGSRLAALSGLRSIESVDDQQPQRGDQPIARGNAPGGGGATEDLRTAMDAVLADDADRDRIGAGIATLLAGTPAAPEETFFVIRRFLAALATNQPVVLAIDDLQWAEPLLLDLVEHLVQWGAGIPLLVLATARPDLRDVRSSLARTGELVSDVVTLAGLDAAAATQLAASVIGADALPAAVAGRVLATSEGNPLFVGELVRMLVADGVLKQEGDRWTAGVDLADLTMPPTIHALLAARIERLAAEDRTVLERAAVVGRQFSRAAVAHLLPAELRARLDARFEALRRSELIEPDTGWFLGEPALRFHHRLTRDAAYRRVLKGTRAELHARCADWIEGKVGDAIEHQETIGWHLEQAHQYARELGPIDSRGQAIGNRAAQYLAAAGRRALARDDVSVAADLLGRAVHVLNEADRARADLALDWCEALLAAGDVAHARGAIDELGRWTGETPSAPSPTHLLSVGEGRGEGASEGDASAAPSASGTLTLPSPALNKRAGEDSGRLRAWHTCFAGRLAVLTDPQSLHATATAVAAAADELAAAGDAAGEANAHLVHAMALSRLGKVGACEAALDKALAAARRGHDRRRANTVLANAPLAALWGPSPVTRASGRCLDVVRVLRITQGAPAVEAVALRCQAVLEALRGRGDAARRMIESSRRMVEELGITQGLLETEYFAGLVALIEGNTAAAEHSLRAAYDGLRNHGLGIDAARAASLLGITLLAQSRAAEAEALSHESEALAGDDLQAAITWRRVRAGALAQRGEHAAAIDLARAAVDIAAATDALIHHADARQALAAALRAAGQHGEAAAEEARAIELWEAKGATVVAERTRSAAREPLPQPRAETERGAELPPSLAGKGARGLGFSRRVRPNAATAHLARLGAAIAARDVDALAALVADDLKVDEHPTGVVYDQRGAFASFRFLMSARDPKYDAEPLATLGDFLVLCRVSMSASGLAGRTFDVGAYERKELHLIEVDAQGRGRRSEVFALDRLGDAVVRLHERYAEVLPAGPERARATAMARSVAAVLGPLDVDRFSTALASAVEFVDRRRVGLPSCRGREAYLRSLGALLEVAADVAHRVHDVLALRSDAHLLRLTTLGADRAGGGAWERPVLVLCVYGTDGLVTHFELFEPDRETEALARFDELTGSARQPLPRPLSDTERGAESQPMLSPSLAGKGARGLGFTRRVRPNAATAFAARVDSAMAARDADALPDLLAEDVEIIDHRNGTAYDGPALLAYLRALLRAQDPKSHSEPLATLGDSLSLFRLSFSARGVAGARFDVGAYDTEFIVLDECDAYGRLRRGEFFAAAHVGDAVARLYECYAELLPDGPERTRAAATARSVAALLAPYDLERAAAAMAPGIQCVDRRILGTWSAHGAEAVLQNLRSWFDLSDDVTTRDDDILTLQSDAFLVRRTVLGTDRSGGGAYERAFLLLTVYGADGRMSRLEWFDVDREAEALARFDELTGEAAESPLATSRVPLLTKEGSGEVRQWGVSNLPLTPSLARRGEEREAASVVTRRVKPNAVTAATARLDAAMARRDGDALAAMFAEGAEFVEHPTGAVYDREGMLFSARSLLKARDPTFRNEPLATLGSSLALTRFQLSAGGLVGGKLDIGAYERDEVVLAEVDANGQIQRNEFFGRDHLGDAVIRLYERYAHLLPEGPERARAAATARSVATMLGPPDVGRNRAALAPAVEFVDHRTLGYGYARGAERILRNTVAQLELEENLTTRIDRILDLRSDALLVQRTNFGTDRAAGGAYERQFLLLNLFGADGGVTRWEQFDADRDDEALARFDELTEHISHARNLLAGIQEGGVDSRLKTAGMTEEIPLGKGRIEEGSPRAVRIENAATRLMDQFEAAWAARDVLATRGQRLALVRSRFELADGDVGPSESDSLLVIESDDRGKSVDLVVAFNPDDLDAAYAELDERYAAGEAAPYAHAWEWLPRLERAAAARDWEHWADVFAPDYVVEDHRVLGWGTLHSREEYMPYLRSLVDLVPDVKMRTDHVLALDDRGVLVIWRWLGSREGGPFEIPFVTVIGLGPDGRVQRSDIYDLEQLDEARAQFEELRVANSKHETRNSKQIRNSESE